MTVTIFAVYYGFYRCQRADALLYGPSHTADLNWGTGMPQQTTDIQNGKYRQRRRGVRVNSRVPVAIEWTQPDSTTRRQEAHTRVIGPYGCLVVLPQDLALEQRIQITNLVNQNKVAAVVVWKGNYRPEGWELGIELQNPRMDFWGLELV